jgi:hypothetical protein
MSDGREDLVAGSAADATGQHRRGDLATAETEWDTADVGGAEVGGALVDGRERAQELVTGLLPLGDEVSVDDLLPDAELVPGVPSLINS